MPRPDMEHKKKRLLDGLCAPNFQTRSVDFLLMDMSGEGIRIIELMRPASVQFVDLCRGNFRLPTEKNFHTIKDITSRRATRPSTSSSTPRSSRRTSKTTARSCARRKLLSSSA